MLLQLAGTATAEIEASLDRATAAGGTPLFDCVAAAMKRLAADGRTDLRAIVLLSDGEDTTSTMLLGEVTPGIRAAEHLLIYAVSYPEGEPGHPGKPGSRGPGPGPRVRSGKRRPAIQDSSAAGSQPDSANSAVGG